MFTVNQVAERLKVSSAFVYARLADGSLHHYRLGNGQGGIRVSEEQLQEYLRGRGRGAKRLIHRPRLSRNPPVVLRCWTGSV